MSDARIVRDGGNVVPNKIISTNQSQNTPFVPPELIPYLRERFTAEVYLGIDMKEVHQMVGHLQVIDHLEGLVMEQSNNVHG